MKFLTFCEQLEVIESTSSRNEISALVAEIYKNATIEDSKVLTYFLQGRINAAFVQSEFAIGEKLILRMFSEKYGFELDYIVSEFKKIGDLGKFTYSFLSSNGKTSIPTNAKNHSLSSICSVYENLDKLQKVSGKDSTVFKIDLLFDLISTASPLEAKYIIRIIAGNIGLGLSDKSIIDSLSILCVGNKEVRSNIEIAFGRRCDLGELAMQLKQYIEEGGEDFIALLSEIKATPGIPISSKLVEREKNPETLFDRLGKCYIQPKFDGLRCQIHAYQLDGKLVIKMFSRNFEDFTHSFPDIVEEIEKLYTQGGKKDFILDSEAIGINLKTGKFLQFGDTMKRKRKHGVEEFAQNIKMQVHIFDILYLGEDILENAFEDRFEKLGSLLANYHGEVLKVSKTDLVESEIELAKIFEKYVADGLEGIIAKKVGTIYEPGTRNFDWIKLKRSTDSKLNDSVDAVVLGYYFGKGERANLGIGGVLVGVYDVETDSYLTLCKVGIGFTEEEFKSHKAELDKITLAPGNEQKFCTKIATQLRPDVWVEPKIVTEIEADEITVSEIHTAGYSLRFPRVIIWGRDKNPRQTTTVSEIKRMFELRFGK